MNNTIKVGEKTYALSPLRIAEQRRALALAQKFTSAQESAKPALVNEINNVFLELILTSIKRADPSVTIGVEDLESAWGYFDLGATWKQLMEISSVSPIGVVN